MPRALEAFDRVRVYDNSRFGQEPQFLLETEHGRVIYLSDHIPEWLERGLWGTDYALQSVRDQLGGRDPQAGPPDKMWVVQAVKLDGCHHSHSLLPGIL